jgi:hypothetical protein
MSHFVLHRGARQIEAERVTGRISTSITAAFSRIVTATLARELARATTTTLETL